MGWNKNHVPKKQRLFSEQLFLGSPTNKEYRQGLMNMLDEAFDALGTLQQPTMSTSPPESEEDREMRKRLTEFIEGVVEDVAMALTGEEWHDVRVCKKAVERNP